ncbi:hypothetical protein VNO77_13735 [Canavalia gladiata]|uniref:Uncharacterized protein n=1 Tax=Canavalia gladiata TaxID=3824 RepID=A0AAN9LY99_CANGL
MPRSFVPVEIYKFHFIYLPNLQSMDSDISRVLLEPSNFIAVLSQCPFVPREVPLGYESIVRQALFLNASFFRKGNSWIFGFMVKHFNLNKKTAREIEPKMDIRLRQILRELYKGCY